MNGGKKSTGLKEVPIEILVKWSPVGFHLPIWVVAALGLAWDDAGRGLNRTLGNFELKEQ